MEFFTVHKPLDSLADFARVFSGSQPNAAQELDVEVLWRLRRIAGGNFSDHILPLLLMEVNPVRRQWCYDTWYTRGWGSRVRLQQVLGKLVSWVFSGAVVALTVPPGLA